jgi:mycoredoxin
MPSNNNPENSLSEEEIEYAGFVEEVNGGNRVVPTLLFSDGVALTNPSAIAVKEKLASLS